jgi:hypothetical protein
MTGTRGLRQRAVHVIEQRGWHQGALEELNGELCIVAALCATRLEGVEAAYHELVNELGSSQLSDWNDAAGRTKDEVIAALRGRTT